MSSFTIFIFIFFQLFSLNNLLMGLVCLVMFSEKLNYTSSIGHCSWVALCHPALWGECLQKPEGINADHTLTENDFFPGYYKICYSWKLIPFCLHFAKETKQEDNWIMDCGRKKTVPSSSYPLTCGKPRSNCDSALSFSIPPSLSPGHIFIHYSTLALLLILFQVEYII